MNTQEFNEQIAQQSAWVSAVKQEMSKVVVGQQKLVNRLILSLLCKGHVLLEGVPGLAKTLSVKALAGTMQAAFSRIQFTPDLLPADLLGTMIYNPEERQFSAKKGPVFANLILADEINRAPAKVQSALLEAMQERQVTLGECSYPLPNPFLVLATQNPIEQEGTYQLPEAQLDRFFMRISIGYPTAEEEASILERYTSGKKPMEDLRPICTSGDIVRLQQEVEGVHTSKEVRSYISAIAAASRKNGALQLGVSTRAAISLLRAAQAHALLDGRDYVIPEDVQEMAEPVLAHRLVLSAEARMRNMTPQRVLQGIMSSVQVPVKVK